MRHRVQVVAVVMVMACGKSESTSVKSTQPPATLVGDAGAASSRDGAASLDARTAQRGGAKPRAAPSSVTRAQVETFIDAWLDDQNQGAFEAYAARYAVTFAGVRRSGKQVVALDRAGWIGERKRMFAKPMVVAARDREISIAGEVAHVQFTQDWRSGTYHDVGPKLMELVLVGGALQIRAERMLASRIVEATTDGGLPLPLSLWRGDVVLDVEASAWGKPRLLAGTVPNPNDQCDEMPAWEEQDEYWRCYMLDPKNVASTYVAEAAIGKPTATAQANLQAPLALYSATRKVCEAMPAEVIAAGQWGIAASEVMPAPAQAVLERTALTVGRFAAASRASCEGAVFALPASQPAPMLWTLTPAGDALKARALEAFAQVPALPRLDAVDSPTLSVTQIDAPAGSASARSLVLVHAEGAVDCQTDGAAFALYERGPTDELTLLLAEGAQARVLAAPDLTGDGRPEMVLDGARLEWDGAAWVLSTVVAFPDELGKCYCECE